MFFLRPERFRGHIPWKTLYGDLDGRVLIGKSAGLMYEEAAVRAAGRAQPRGADRGDHARPGQARVLLLPAQPAQRPRAGTRLPGGARGRARALPREATSAGSGAPTSSGVATPTTSRGWCRPSRPSASTSSSWRSSSGRPHRRSPASSPTWASAPQGLSDSIPHVNAATGVRTPLAVARLIRPGGPMGRVRHLVPVRVRHQVRWKLLAANKKAASDPPMPEDARRTCASATWRRTGSCPR